MKVSKKYRKRDIKSHQKSSEEIKELSNAKKDIWGSHTCDRLKKYCPSNYKISKNTFLLKKINVIFETQRIFNPRFCPYYHKVAETNVSLRSFEESQTNWSEEVKEIIARSSNGEKESGHKISQSSEYANSQSPKAQSKYEESIQSSNSIENFMIKELKLLDADISKRRKNRNNKIPKGVDRDKKDVKMTQIIKRVYKILKRIRNLDVPKSVANMNGNEILRSLSNCFEIKILPLLAHDGPILKKLKVQLTDQFISFCATKKMKNNIESVLGRVHLSQNIIVRETNIKQINKSKSKLYGLFAQKLKSLWDERKHRNFDILWKVLSRIINLSLSK